MSAPKIHSRPAGAYYAMLRSGGLWALMLGITGATAMAGDLLRGGYTTAGGGGASAPGSFTPPSEVKARANMVDQLARATQEIQAVGQMQSAARAIASAAVKNNAGINPNNPSQQLPNVPNGLTIGGLEPVGGAVPNTSGPGYQIPSSWSGVGSLTQAAASNQTTVNVGQNKADAILYWTTFNIGKNTALNFNQTNTGATPSKSIAFNIIQDSSINPSQILGAINASGQVYVINQNGIIFGGASQVNVHTLVASSLPIDTYFIGHGLLNNPDNDFLFSANFEPSGANGTPAFTPPVSSLPSGAEGNIVVQAGAQITAPANADSTGGRVALIGPNVTNNGTISTPDGQTILAAGQQVAFTASSDPTLRGLDTYIGPVGTSGAATNNGLIEVDEGDATLAGRYVNQMGVIANTTSVSLNGRIDLDASYGTHVVPGANSTLLFAPTATGNVTLGAGSLTEILPDLASTATVVGTQLALSSQVNIQGETIHFATNSQLLAPNASVNVSAGSWMEAEGSPAEIIPNSGQIYLDAGATIDVAGSIVSAPVSQNIVSAELLGPQLADSPLQRNGFLYGQTIQVDARDTGVYDGVQWQGTPLANVSGYIALIELPVGELTTAGGTVSLTAGGSVVMQPGSEINVSGGAINYQGGYVKTTDLLYDGQIINIANATPDLVYQGILGQFTVSSPKWGIEETYTTPLVGGAVYQNAYAEGGNGGAITIQAPSMALNGQLLGQTTIGPRQLAVPPTASSVTLSFVQETSANNTYLSPTPPDITFETDAALPPAPAFALDSSGDPLALPALNQHEVILSPDLFSEDGFGALTVNNGDGNINVPAGVALNAPAFGSVSFTAANLTIGGSITAPDGALNFTVDYISPYGAAQSSTRGNFVLAPGATLSTAGLIVDNLEFSPTEETLPEALGGGSVTIDSFSANLAVGSSIDVSGGVMGNPTGTLTYGNGGTITIKAGQDPVSTATLGGRLNLGATLTGYSGAAGGTLSILAPAIQIGAGTPADPAALVLAPSFFDQGGFSDFSLTGLGSAIGNDPLKSDLPAVDITPGTVVSPVAENWLGAISPLSADGITLTRVLLPEAQRTPVTLSLSAPGVVDNTKNQLIVRGDFVMGSGASITTDAGGSVSISGNTVTVLGSIDAPGGKITIKGGSDSSTLFDTITTPLVTLYLGPDSILSTAGTTVLTPDVYGYLTGSVLPGGSISISGNIVAAAGSVLNVSGASGVLYLPQSETTLIGQETGSFLGAPVAPVRVDSNGGTITIAGTQELFSDATLIGNAGGPAAMGGNLIISSSLFVPEGDPTLPSTDIDLTVTQGGLTAPTHTGIGQSVLGSKGQVLSQAGGGFLAANDFLGGGFNQVTLGGSVQFNGSVTIRAAGELSVGSGGVISTEGNVNLIAPYVVLGVPFAGPLTATEAAQPVFSSNGTTIDLTPTAGAGHLTVSASLIDIGNLSLQDIDQANFIATNGAIRGDGTLDVEGQINMTAGQIYPATDVIFTIAAYNDGGTPGTITIHGSAAQDLPLSAGGTLNLYASVINQDGVLSAPIGMINLGWNSSAGTAPTDLLTGAPVDSTTTLTLGSQSITSVSAVDPLNGKALIIPYGINPSGTQWIDPAGNDINTGGVPEKAINLAGTQIVDKAGSVVDLSGGGDLSSYEFIAGEGGSTDFLNPGEQYNGGLTYTTGALVTYKGNTYVADQESVNVTPGVNQYWSEVPTSYAVIPGYQATYAPYAPFNTAVGDPGYVSNNLAAGQQVYLSAGSGLSPGVYTLLPARYALLPGAYLVTPESGKAAPSLVQPDGSSIVSGYQFNGFSNPGGLTGPLISLFQLDSQSVVLSRGQYTTFLANTFLAQEAAKNKVATPLLPIDAGPLNINATSTLVLHGIVDEEAPAGGLAGFVDINSSSAIDITSASSPASPAGTLTLSSSELSSFGAANLLIGGFTTTGADGTTLNVDTNDVTVESGATLTGGDIILVANDTLNVQKGAVIAAAGAPGGQPATLIVQDQNELQAPGDNLAFGVGGVPITFPSGTSGNKLTATATVTITAPGGGTTTYSPGTPFVLTAGSTVTLAAGGGTLSFKSGTGGPIQVLLGDGALLQASTGAPTAIVRSGVAGLTGGVTGGSPISAEMDISGGATISGASVTINSTAGASIGSASSTANISGKSISIGASRISIQLNNPGSLPLGTPGLVLAQNQLASLKASEELSLLSYSSIDFYGSGEGLSTLSLDNLSLSAAQIRTFNQGTGGPVMLAARDITLVGNPDATAPAPGGAANGTLVLNGGVIELGGAALEIDSNLQLNGAGGIMGNGSGTPGTASTLLVAGNLTTSAPLITAAAAAQTAITSDGAVSITGAGSTKVEVSGGLGASLSITGQSITDDGNIALPSGSISLITTNGNLMIGDVAPTELSVKGTEKTLVNAVRYTPGGTINLIADDAGDVTLGADGAIDVSAQTGGGSAGTLNITVPKGSVSLLGTLLGGGGAGGESGSFSLDAGSIPSVIYKGKTYAQGSVDSIDDILNAGGCEQSISIRDQQDANVTLDETVTAASYNLSADQGSITVLGTINADDVASVGPSGNAISIGGSITLTAAGDITIGSSTDHADLNVSAQNFNNAGQGGSVILSAGAGIVNGDASTAGSVIFEAGSTINLSVADSANVAAAVEALLKEGQTPSQITADIENTDYGNDFAGTLLIQTPQATVGSDQVLGNIIGAVEATTAGGTPVAVPDAASIVVEGYNVYNVNSYSSTGVITQALQQQIYSDGVAFLGAKGATTLGYTNLVSSLVGSNADLGVTGLVNQTTQGLTFNVETGAEIINPSGNLVLANDWDLENDHFGLNGTAGQLTLRASGNLIFNNTLSDGFAGSGNTALLLQQNAALPANIQSWSYTLTAGADLAAVSPEAVLSQQQLASGAGSLELGINDATPYTTNGSNPITETTASVLNGYYQVIRTGAGSIDISTAANVELLNQFASIYTAGAQVLDPAMGSTFSVPYLNESNNTKAGLGAGKSNPTGYAAQYSVAGGNVTLAAQGSIEHLTIQNGSLVMDSEDELPDNWLYRRGDVTSTGIFDSNPNIPDPSESTTWWVDFSNFFEGVGALGGGNVTMTAGADIANVDAVVPTNARMPGIDPATNTNLAPNASGLVELGGGDLVVQAGNDINAGVYYVENGQGTLGAGNQILTNSTRAPVGGESPTQGKNVSPQESWLPTTLFAGDASFNISAGGNVLMGPVANPFLLPEGLENSIWYKTYFSTYGLNDSVNVTSLGGNITFDEYAVTADSNPNPEPILQAWLQNTDLLVGQTVTYLSRAYYQPWLRINESSVVPFSVDAELLPPRLVATAFAGNINIVGTLLLSPSPSGTIDLAASGSLIGFQLLGQTAAGSNLDWEEATIDISDSNPASVPDVTTPIGYQEVPGIGSNYSGAHSTSTTLDFLAPISDLFAATDNSGLEIIQTEQALHDSGILHTGDSNPVELYAAGGDITGVTLYSPTETQVVAGQDITDISLYLQNDDANAISVISAGGDIVAYDPSSPARQPAQGSANTIYGLTPAGDIQIAGPGTLEVLAGADLELGGQGPGGASNTTGDGIASIGNTQNPALPFAGADIIAAAGIGSSAGLGQSEVDFSSFISQYIEAPAGATYLGELSQMTSSFPGVTSAASFSALAPSQQDLLALDVFFLVLRDAGRDHNLAGSAGYGNYGAGLAAIAALFPQAGPGGDIDVTSRDIVTESGGNISLLAPKGQVTVGLNSTGGNDVTNLGIVTQDGGNISIFSSGDVNVGTSRIFTLAGGNEILWSSGGNIDAGASSKTVQSAPPTRVLVDPQSADVQTDLAGLATGGGIGVLASLAGVPPGNVDLIAPTGVVNAGEAGIRATGNLNIAAVQVLNAGNISAGGASTGLPPAIAAPNIAGLAAASNVAGSSLDSATTVQNPQANTQDHDASSIITVQVIGYGGGDGDDSTD
jgi:filamentous hemagglutinin family protein